MREVLLGWDPKRTEVLKQARKEAMRAALEQRLSSTAEREALARELIRDELVELTKVRCRARWMGLACDARSLGCDTHVFRSPRVRPCS